MGVGRFTVLLVSVQSLFKWKGQVEKSIQCKILAKSNIWIITNDSVPQQSTTVLLLAKSTEEKTDKTSYEAAKAKPKFGGNSSDFKCSEYGW